MLEALFENLHSVFSKRFSNNGLAFIVATGFCVMRTVSSEKERNVIIMFIVAELILSYTSLY